MKELRCEVDAVDRGLSGSLVLLSFSSQTDCEMKMTAPKIFPQRREGESTRLLAQPLPSAGGVLLCSLLSGLTGEPANVCLPVRYHPSLRKAVLHIALKLMFYLFLFRQAGRWR